MQQAQPVDQPYRDFSPELRSLKLLATETGRSALLLAGANDDLAFIDERGKITATVHAPNLVRSQLQIDETGRLHGLSMRVLDKDPAWHFATAVEIVPQTIDPQGRWGDVASTYQAETASLPPDWEAGFAVAPDGNRSLVSLAGALLAFGPNLADSGKLAPMSRQVYRDVDRAGWRFSLLYPRHAVGSTFSPDGQLVLFTMDSRPPFGGLGSPAYRPTGSETVLWDLKSGEVRWRLAAGDYQASPYAVHSGFAAVSRDGQRTALAGFDGGIYLLDAAGKPLIEEQIASPAVAGGGRIGPTDGVGVRMSPGGELTAFAFKKLLVLAAGKRLTRIEIPGITGVAVLGDGSAAVVATSSGELRAFDPAGKPLWTAKTGPGTLVAAAGNRLLAATGTGELVMLDAEGQEIRRTNVAAAADKSKHSPEPPGDMDSPPPAPSYLEPDTLAVAQRELKAKEIARWKSTGPAIQAWGKEFHPLAGKIELSAGSAENALVHLVYRRLPNNKSLSVTTADATGTSEFLLDLPTPNFRVVDLPLAAGGRVVVSSDGPAEVAECSLWSFSWPGPDLCYVKPARAPSSAPAKTGSAAGDIDDLLDEAVDKPAAAGVANRVKLYCANSDPDRVAGTYLPVPVDPMRIADGRRFEEGKLPAWAPANTAYFPTRGAFVAFELGKAAPLGLVATYDRSLRQSQVTGRIVVFTTEGLDDLTSGKVLAGDAANDQFWRLFPLQRTKLGGFGVHIYNGASQAAGLSEVEAYR